MSSPPPTRQVVDPLRTLATGAGTKQLWLRRARTHTKPPAADDGLDQHILHPEAPPTDTGLRPRRRLTQHHRNEITQLSHLLLDVRRLVMKDAHINLDIDSALPGQPHKPLQQTPLLLLVLRKTVLRAQRVNATFRLYYLNMERLLRSAGHDSELELATPKSLGDAAPDLTPDLAPDLSLHPPHTGVDGVYNPLQVIRNRAIRQRHNEMPRGLTVQTVKPALQAFSRHANDPAYHLPWQVDLKEVLSDFAFRQRHWGELTRPDGQLWFPWEQRHPEPRPEEGQHLQHTLQSPDSSDSPTPGTHLRPLEHRRGFLASIFDLQRGRRKQSLSKESGSSRSHSFTQQLGQAVRRMLAQQGPPDEESVASDAESVANLLDALHIGFAHAMRPPPDSAPVVEEVDPTSDQDSMDSEVGDEKEADESVGLKLTAHHVLHGSSGHPDLLAVLVRTIDHLRARQAMARWEIYVAHRRFTHTAARSEAAIETALLELWKDIHAAADEAIPRYTQFITDGERRVEEARDTFDQHLSRTNALMALLDLGLVEINLSMTLELKRLYERMDGLDPKRKLLRAVNATTGYQLLEYSVVGVLWLMWVLVLAYRVVRFAVRMVVSPVRTLASVIQAEGG